MYSPMSCSGASLTFIYTVKKNKSTCPEPGEMAQQPSVLVALAEGPGLIPSAHMVAAMVYKSNSTGSYAFFWPPWALGTRVVHRLAGKKHLCR